MSKRKKHRNAYYGVNNNIQKVQNSEEVRNYMITVNFDNNFEINVDERKLKDYRFLKKLVQVMKAKTEDDELVIFEVTHSLFGDDEDKLLDYLAENNDGYCDPKNVAEAIRKVMTAVQGVRGNEGKN